MYFNSVSRVIHINESFKGYLVQAIFMGILGEYQ